MDKFRQARWLARNYINIQQARVSLGKEDEMEKVRREENGNRL